LGVFRLQHDVLDHHPGLLFVELAFNVGGASPGQIYRSAAESPPSQVHYLLARISAD
jgi:hypothetical protein